MYEFHGWFGLAQSPSEIDSGGLAGAIDDLRHVLVRFGPPHAVAAEVCPLNGQYFLWMNGFLNRPRDQEAAIDDVLGFLAERLPGSWGIIYERSDEWCEPPLANSFRVRVLTRGNVSTPDDPFLSPWQPTIED
mgnify:CR=1 FL=1